MRTLKPLFVSLLLVLLAACGALREDLKRAEQTYQEARYQDTLTWLESLEPHLTELDRPLRARYYYLRGMTTYRLGRRNDALHFLALAREEAVEGRGLEAEQQAQMKRAIEELTPSQATYHAREAEAE